MDLRTTVDFPDMEVCATSLFQAIPLQRKASKAAQISFLCQLFMLVRQISMRSTRFTRIPDLAGFASFMEKVMVEARRLIGCDQKTERDDLVVSKQVSVTEVDH